MIVGLTVLDSDEIDEAFVHRAADEPVLPAPRRPGT
jgi:hypothetical protein